jgi:fructose-1,6-bisphosphatase/inositol monophosphatase family enzyme
MPVYALSRQPNQILQNIVYAVPQRIVRIKSSVAIEYAPLFAGTFAALTGADTLAGVEVCGGFIRCTTAGAEVICGA